MTCDCHADVAAYEDLHQLYCEWVDGIEMTTGRIACLRELERLKRQEGLEWRCSGKIRKQVMERKVLIYAVLRRLPDPAGESRDHAASSTLLVYLVHHHLLHAH